MSKVLAKFVTAARDQLRDWIEGGPFEPLTLRTLDLIRSPSPSTLAERRDLVQMRQIYERVLRPDSNAVDVGANIGRVVRMFTQYAPRGAHHAFEPTPRLAARLRKHFPNVHIHETALGNEAGEVNFYHQIRRHPESGLAKPPGGDDEVETLTVSIARLDDVIDRDLPIALIKIDVEGAEYQVLEGAAATIDRHRPHIIFEFGSGAMQNFNITPQAIHTLMTERFNLQMRTLEGFLADDPPLDLAASVRAVDAREVYNFIASPT